MRAAWLLVVAACGGPTTPPPADPATEPPDPARALLDGALAVKGGEAVTSLRSLVVEAEGTISVAGQTVYASVTRAIVVPDRMRVDVVIEELPPIAYAVDGAAGWQSGPDDLGAPQVKALELESRAQVWDQLWRDPELVLTRHLETGAEVLQLDDVTVDGIACALVNVTSGVSTVSIYLDRQTQRVVQLAYPERGAVTEERYGDYRVVDGIEVAHERRAVSGEEATDLRVVRVEIDADVDLAIFRQPSY